MNFGKKVWLIGNSSEKSKKTLNKLSKILKAEHFVFDDINPEIVISVGGDGTLLRAMHMYEYQLDRVRFLGVHTGHLGFYTDFTDEDLFEVVMKIQLKRFTIHSFVFKLVLLTDIKLYDMFSMKQQFDVQVKRWLGMLEFLIIFLNVFVGTACQFQLQQVQRLIINQLEEPLFIRG